MATLADHGIYLRRMEPGKFRASCPQCCRSRHGDQALSVTVKPDLQAVWCCHRCGFRGAVPAPGPRDRELFYLTRANVTYELSNVEHMHPKLSDEGEALWNSCEEITVSTPAHRYLTQARKLELAKAPDLHRALRWLPALEHPRGYRGPALVALVTDAVTGEARNLHRTWLAKDGSGKAAIDTPRLLLKGHRKKGGVVRLVELQSTLGFAEGIETALSAVTLGISAWACIDANNMASLPVLTGVDRPWIFADNDPVGRKAAQELAERWAGAGREVAIHTPEQSGTDLNDELRGAR